MDRKVQIVPKTDGDTEKKYLIHYWSGKDAVVDGIWYDKIGDFNWRLYNYTQENEQVCLENSPNSYGISTKQCSEWDLGNYFKIYFDGEVYFGNISSANLIDIGSTCGADKNIGFSFQKVTNSIGKGISINWKVLGGSSNPGLTPSLTSTGTTIFPMVINTWHKIKISYFNKDNGDYDKFGVTLNGETQYFSCNVQKVEYKNFQNNGCYLSRGVAVNADSGYYCGMKINSLKIYKYS